MQLFADNNLAGPDTVKLLPFGGNEGSEELLSQNIDALFLVTRAGSPLVHKLFLDPRVKLVNLARASLFTALSAILGCIPH